MEVQILHHHFEWQERHGLWSASTVKQFASLLRTYAPLTAVIFATQNGGKVSGFPSTIRFTLVT